jgi:uncharacterized protein YPO0396
MSALNWTAITQAAEQSDGGPFLADQLACTIQERDACRERLTNAHREQQEARSRGFTELASTLRQEVTKLEGRAAHWSASASRLSRIIAESKGRAA